MNSIQYYLDIFEVTQQQLRKVAEAALSRGGDYCDFYFENTTFFRIFLSAAAITSDTSWAAEEFGGMFIFCFYVLYYFSLDSDILSLLFLNENFLSVPFISLFMFSMCLNTMRIAISIAIA